MEEIKVLELFTKKHNIEHKTMEKTMTRYLKTLEAYKNGNKKAAYLMYLNDSTVHTVLDYSSFCEYFDGLCK